HGGTGDGRRDLLQQLRHLPTMPYSNWVKPVMLPPGCERLSTTPRPTGSIVWANTIGTLRLARTSGNIEVPDIARTASGLNATSSAAWAARRSALPELPR